MQGLYQGVSGWEQKEDNMTAHAFERLGGRTVASQVAYEDANDITEIRSP
jgi:hypothetical protein